MKLHGRTGRDPRKNLSNCGMDLDHWVDPGILFVSLLNTVDSSFLSVSSDAAVKHAPDILQRVSGAALRLDCTGLSRSSVLSLQEVHV